MNRTILKIDGMACGMCEAHINDCIRQNFRIKKIRTSRIKGKSEIISDAGLNEDKLKEIIEQNGYTLRSVVSEDGVRRGSELKQRRRKNGRDDL